MMTDIITQIDALKYAAAALLSQEREQETRLEVLLTKLESEPGGDDQEHYDESLKGKIDKLKEELEEMKKEREECRNKLEDLEEDLKKVSKKQKDVDGIIESLGKIKFNK